MDVLNPVDWFRKKLHGGIEVHVQTSLKDVYERIEVLRQEIISGSLHTRIDDLTRATSEHLHTVDQLSQATNAIALDLSRRLETASFDLAKRLDTVHYESLDNRQRLDDLIQRVEDLNQELNVLSSRIRANPFANNVGQVTSANDGRNTIGFVGERLGEYVDFADVFRPAFNDLVNQLAYLKNWLPRVGRGVDLGAGRGEMVQVMLEHGLNAIGIDIDSSMVDEAMSRGLDVRLSGADDFFNSCGSGSLAAVTAIQVVEHVDTPTLEHWFAEAKRVLQPGGVFIAETPNPHAVDAFKAFWVDVTHVRPYYPESLLHMAQSAGFTRAEIWVEGDQESIYDRLGIAGSYAIIATA